MTVTVHDAVFPPSFVVAVMTAIPALTPVTLPPSTVAISVSLLSQITSWSVASEGEITAVIVLLSPSSRDNSAGLIIRPDTATETTT